MSANEKTLEVTMHSDGYRNAHPAVNVKLYTSHAQLAAMLPLDLGSSAEMLPDGTVGELRPIRTDPEFTWEWIQANLSDEDFQSWWDLTCEDGFTDAKELAAETFGPDAQVYSEGRSSGWLVVHNIGDPEDWTQEQFERWTTFSAAVRVIADDVPLRTLSNIYANRFEPEQEQEQAAAAREAATQYVVITGQPFGRGMTLHGPFPTASAAEEFSATRRDPGTVVPVEPVEPVELDTKESN